MQHEEEGGPERLPPSWGAWPRGGPRQAPSEGYRSPERGRAAEHRGRGPLSAGLGCMRPAVYSGGPVLRGAGDHDPQVGGGVPLPDGGLRAPGGLPLLLGQRHRPQALVLGHHLPELRQLRRGALLPGIVDHPGELCQRPARQPRPEPLHRRQAAGHPGHRDGRRRPVGTRTLAELFQFLRGRHDLVRLHWTGVLQRALGLRRLESTELYHRGTERSVPEPATGHPDRHPPGDGVLCAGQRVLLHRDDRHRTATVTGRRHDLWRPGLLPLLLDRPSVRGLLHLRLSQWELLHQRQADLRGEQGGSHGEDPVLHQPEALHTLPGAHLQ
ncbi:hypothetical protein NHX12_005329, partial [Muraenolepis orangiensis]